LSSLLKISVSVYFIFCSSVSFADLPFQISAGAGEAGIGSVCIMRDGFWSSFQNQAALAYKSSISLGLNYENRFSMKELGTKTAGIIIPVGKASIGVVYSHFGYSDYKRHMTGIACGLKLSDKISAGVQIDYLSEKASKEFNNSQSVTFEAGVIIRPSENTSIGVHIFNPVPNSIRKYNMPSTLRIGAGTLLSNILFAGVEAEMSSGSDLIIKTGFEYEAVKNVWLRGGYSTKNSSFSFGLGYLMKMAQIDFGFVTHEKLGVTSSVSLIFKIR
jgi:hypothetical protein